MPTLKDERFDWVNKALGNLIGAGLGTGPLARSKAIRDLSPETLDRIDTALRSKLHRYVDVQTGAVAYHRRGDFAPNGALLIDGRGHGGASPTQAVRDLLAQIEFESLSAAMTAARTETWRDSIGAKLDALDVAIDDGETGGNRVVRLVHNIKCDLSELRRDIDKLEGKRVQDERARHLLSTAADMLDVVKRHAIEALRLTLSEQIELVSENAEDIAEHARRLQDGFSDRGVSELEVERIPIGCHTLNLRGFIADAAALPQLWLDLSRTGEEDEVDDILDTVRLLADDAEDVRSLVFIPNGEDGPRNAIAEYFGFDDQDETAVGVLRLCGMVEALRAALENTSDPVLGATAVDDPDLRKARAAEDAAGSRVRGLRRRLGGEDRDIVEATATLKKEDADLAKAQADVADAEKDVVEVFELMASLRGEAAKFTRPGNLTDAELREATTQMVRLQAAAAAASARLARELREQDAAALVAQREAKERDAAQAALAHEQKQAAATKELLGLAEADVAVARERRVKAEGKRARKGVTPNDTDTEPMK